MKIKNITIVGGGTSAWLAAAYLHHNNPDISITVVDKEVGNPIGVGEATLLSFKPFMEECGFPVDEWISEIDAGFKSGILFTNWRHDGDSIWHPFLKGNRQLSTTVRLWDLWSQNQELDFKKYAMAVYESSLVHNTVDLTKPEIYGYHVDCGKLIVYIQKKLKNKINIIRSEVVNVVTDNSDHINRLELLDSTIIESDLYIDCTGFKQVLGKPKHREDLSNRLFVNTAVVCQVPYEDRDTEFKPYAVCDATDHGWLWKIGVSSRIGSGMIFNRHITSIDEAKDYFTEYWKGRISRDKIRVIDWDPFYIKDQWRGNVVNIGLSAGFIEPLESTGIGLITIGVTRLHNAIQERHVSLLEVEKFNLIMNILFDDCVDFVSAHYVNNTRTSKFWQFVKDTFKPSDRMNHQISELSDQLIGIPYDGKYDYMFTGANWSLLLIQLGFSVAQRNTNLNKDTALDLIIGNYVEHEKHRHVWSRHHSTEIDRIIELTKTLKNI